MINVAQPPPGCGMQVHRRELALAKAGDAEGCKGNVEPQINADERGFRLYHSYESRNPSSGN